MKEELTPIRFGTDGWRAVIAEGFTFANLERVAQAYADYLLQQSETKDVSLLQQLVSVRQISKDEAESNLFRDVIQKASPPLVIVGFDRRFLSEKFAERAAEVRDRLYRKPWRWRLYTFRR